MADRPAHLSERVIGLMEEAERLLEPPLSSDVKIALSHFHDFVNRDDAESAWDAISEAGLKGDAPPAFWRFLADAANALGLVERAAEANRRKR